MKRVVVVGGSIAGLTAAEALRAGGFDGRLTMLSEELHLPYSRVPLSKGVLAGREPLESASLPAPSEGIEFRAGVRATGLDIERRTVTFGDGETEPYDGLVIATGARARRLPDTEAGAAFAVRTLDDAAMLRARLPGANSVIVLGGGFLGMEVASTCRALGLDVTAVDRVPPLRRLVGPWLARLVMDAARDHGVKFRLAGDGVAVIDQQTVRLGGTVLTADVIVSAVGDEPNVSWLHDSGLPLGAGVVADDCCRVVPGVAAAGDVVARDGVRNPHWTNAIEQGRAAATALLHGDAAEPYRPNPYFWTEQFGLNIKISGQLPTVGDPTILAGSVEDRSLLLRWNHGGPPTAVAINHRIAVDRLKLHGAGAPHKSSSSASRHRETHVERCPDAGG
ncbi:NAD(P)/FAD-dependent oxidoreductase [Nocardia aobensis]|uniref:NAD(P)/FAD-dependent oxidoreductase n=1 Tax=Nocardia aobensis TaxID=257277 RepID=A0ABW6PES9_9NOCA